MQFVETAIVSGPFALRRPLLGAADMKSPDTARARAWLAEGPGGPVVDVAGNFGAFPVPRPWGVLAVVEPSPGVQVPGDGSAPELTGVRILHEPDEFWV